jgi:hypothetical protein
MPAMKEQHMRKDKPRIVFAHIVWMDRYNGDYDTIYKAGWRWDLAGHEGENTGEQFNFCFKNNEVRGYVARFYNDANGNHHFKKMDITRLGAKKNAASYVPVTVVWTATPHDGGDRVIVGWYDDATAYREPQESKNPRNETDWYFFRAKPDKCYLVPPKLRNNHRIKTSQQAGAGNGPGHDALFYPDKELARNVANYLKELRKTLAPLSKTATFTKALLRSRVAARQPDIEKRYGSG